jgi:hypothetical protein
MPAPCIIPTLDSLATKQWGSFWDANVSQTIPSNNATAIITLNNSDPSNNGVSMVSGSQMTFTYGGVYSITFSIQFANSSATMYDAQVWLRKNGVTSAFDVADSNSRFSITSKHGSTNGHVLGTVNFVISLNANDYIVLAWSAENTSVVIETTAASTGTPTAPRTPAVILTAVQV